MDRRVWMTWLATGLTASLLLAEPSIVKTKDGNTYQGDMTMRNESIVITIHGVETIIPQADVDSITKADDLDKVYRDEVATLDAKDVNGRIAVARKAIDKQRWEFAQTALTQALTIEPNNPEASDLLNTVNSQIKLDQTKGTPLPEAPPHTPVQPAQPNQSLLSPVDIDNIRKAELKPTDVGVRVQIDQAARKKYVESHNLVFSQFNNMPAVQEAIAILDSGDPALRDSVHVLTDPPSMLMYRREIQPMIIQNCATATCHGGSTAGKLIFPTAGDPDQLTYTNFFILQQYRVKIGAAPQGVFGTNEKGLIERGHAADSLLLNYLLPTSVATFDHPNVGGKPITPVLKGPQDPKFAALNQWMNLMLVQSTPSYGIHYNMPTTQPMNPPGQ